MTHINPHQPIEIEIRPNDLFPEWLDIFRADLRIATIKVLPDEIEKQWFILLSGHLRIPEYTAVQKTLQFAHLLRDPGNSGNPGRSS